MFLFTENQSPTFQIAKIFLAALHSMVMILPVYLAQSPRLILKIVGYVSLTTYFLYIFFLVGFFPYFGFVPELYTFGTANAADMSEVLEHYFKQIFGYRELLLLATGAVLIYLIPRNRLSGRALLVLLLLPLALFSTSVYKFGSPGASEAFGNETLVRRFGLTGFSYISITEWLNLEGGYLGTETAFPGKVAELVFPNREPAEPLVSLPQNISRVILIQIESFDPEAIEAKLSGIAVMPFVTDLRNKCINYTNFFTMKAAGGSSDTEFAVATGLVPSLRLPSLRHADFARVETVYDSLLSAGISSRFAHNNNAGFYGRNIAYNRLNVAKADFQNPNETIAEHIFAKKALAASLAGSEKSFHYFFNFQSHGPYQGYSDSTQEKYSIGLNPGIKTDYLATMSEVDQMVAALFSMQRAGFDKGENLFILTADHPSRVHSTNDTISPFRIPAMICHDSFLGTVSSDVFGTIDLHPTILEAFGLASGRKFLGSSMFQSSNNAVLLPQGRLIYKNSNGKVTSKACTEKCSPFVDYTDQHILLQP